MRYEKRKVDVLYIAADVADELYASFTRSGRQLNRERAWEYFITERQRKLALSGASLENAKKAFYAMFNFMMGPNPPEPRWDE